MTVPSYVPNDTLLEGGKLQAKSSDHEVLGDVPEVSTAAPNPSMLLLTGPNYSGKSVYMKQVSTSPLHSIVANSAIGSIDHLPSTSRQVNTMLREHIIPQD